MKYFTSIRNDVLENFKLSLGAKGLYCLICFDVTTSLRQLLLDPNTKAETIIYTNAIFFWRFLVLSLSQNNSVIYSI